MKEIPSVHRSPHAWKSRIMYLRSLGFSLEAVNPHEVTAEHPMPLNLLSFSGVSWAADELPHTEPETYQMYRSWL